jgi:FkbM family methyltransferase
MKSILPILKTVFADNRPRDWSLYTIKAVIWQLRKRWGHSFDVCLDNGAKVRVHPSTAYSGIFYARHPEGDDLAFIRKHADLANTFVDVGANVGLFSASLFDCFKKVICFEPAPSSFRALSETCALNPQVKCELHNIGVGDEPGELFFEDEFDYSTTSRFVAEGGGENTIRIAIDTLDRILGVSGEPLVMKVDVEGFEERVFAGADKLFASQRVKLLMFERLGRTNIHKVCGFFGERGYTVFRVVEGLHTTTDAALIFEPCINLFACPSELYSQLAS